MLLRVRGFVLGLVRPCIATFLRFFFSLSLSHQVLLIWPYKPSRVLLPSLTSSTASLSFRVQYSVYTHTTNFIVTHFSPCGRRTNAVAMNGRVGLVLLEEVAIAINIIKPSHSSFFLLQMWINYGTIIINSNNNNSIYYIFRGSWWLWSCNNLILLLYYSVIHNYYETHALCVRNSFC